MKRFALALAAAGILLCYGGSITATYSTPDRARLANPVQAVERAAGIYRTNVPATNVRGTSGPDYVPGQLVVLLHNDADKDEVKQALQDVDGHIVEMSSDGSLTFALVQLANKEQKSFATNYAKLCSKQSAKLSADRKLFDQVSLNMHYQADTTAPPAYPAYGGVPNDPAFFYQPQVFVHNAILAQESLAKHNHKMPLPNGAITIGVIDTGVQGNAPDFAPGQVLKGLNAFTGGPGNVDTDTWSGVYGHGTFNASIIAAQANNRINGIGLLPGATIDPVDAFNGQVLSDTFHIIKGIQFLQKEPGVRYINMSIQGWPPYTLNADPAYMAAARAFYTAKNGTIFNAAGNAGLVDNSAVQPWNVVVEAVDVLLNVAWFSNTGKFVSLAGCGVADGSTNRYGMFLVSDGTSFATPSCCAVAAAIQYANPSLTALQTIKLMQNASYSKKASNGLRVPDENLCVQSITGP